MALYDPVLGILSQAQSRKLDMSGFHQGMASLRDRQRIAEQVRHAKALEAQQAANLEENQRAAKARELNQQNILKQQQREKETSIRQKQYDLAAQGRLQEAQAIGQSYGLKEEMVAPPAGPPAPIPLPQGAAAPAPFRAPEADVSAFLDKGRVKERNDSSMSRRGGVPKAFGREQAAALQPGALAGIIGDYTQGAPVSALSQMTPDPSVIEAMVEGMEKADDPENADIYKVARAMTEGVVKGQKGADHVMPDSTGEVLDYIDAEKGRRAKKENARIMSNRRDDADDDKLFDKGRGYAVSTDRLSGWSTTSTGYVSAQEGLRMLAEEGRTPSTYAAVLYRLAKESNGGRLAKDDIEAFQGFLNIEDQTYAGFLRYIKGEVSPDQLRQLDTTLRQMVKSNRAEAAAHFDAAVREYYSMADPSRMAGYLSHMDATFSIYPWFVDKMKGHGLPIRKGAPKRIQAPSPTDLDSMEKELEGL